MSRSNFNISSRSISSVFRLLRVRRKRASKTTIWAGLILTAVLLITTIYLEQSPIVLPESAILGTKNSDTDLAEQSSELYEVVSVTDGDTLKVMIDGKTTTVRLANINVPESVDPRRPVECMGIEASEKLHELLAEKRVFLEPDDTQAAQDRYGRLVRFVFLEDGTDIGLTMISLGFAHSTPYGSTPHAYLEEYTQTELEAQRAKRGLWNPNNCPSNNQ